MSLQVEKLENNTAKLTIEVAAEEVEKAIEKAYQKNKNRFQVPGFRKGKVPRNMIEKMYGVQVFYEDAVNDMLPEAYASAATESGLDIVARPEIEVTQIEKGKPFIFTAEVTLKPEVELGDYKGITVEAQDTTVSDEDIDAEIKKALDQNARIITVDDRAVQDGDQTVIDFEGFVDGEPFEGGKAEGYSLTIGSHSFIDTFEEQLIGKNIGEEVEVNVTFPEEYHAEELAGKPALFKVTVKEIKVKELPELDDEFAQEVSEFDTLDEYKADIKKNLEEAKVKEADQAKEAAVIKAIVENAKMDIPEKMVVAQAQKMVEEFAQQIAAQGMAFDQYLQYTGATADSMVEQVKPQALENIKSRLVLEAVAAAENIVASEDDYEEEIKKMAESYNMEVDKVKSYISEDDKTVIMKDIAVKKAAELVVAESK
ncbi:MAG: trigger factor [Lachnospiraceae bacterium]|nr:trigger factor [Lachnospiraceae bacterium]